MEYEALDLNALDRRQVRDKNWILVVVLGHLRFFSLTVTLFRVRDIVNIYKGLPFSYGHLQVPI